jgi:hypothetical protein
VTLRSWIRKLFAWIRTLHAGANTILFDPKLVAKGPASIDLSTIGDFTAGPSALAVTSTMLIVGPLGANGITIDRSSPSDFRLFYVSPTGNLTLQNLTLSGGIARGRRTTKAPLAG